MDTDQLKDKETTYKIKAGVTIYGELVLLKAIGIEQPTLTTESSETQVTYPNAGQSQKFP